LQFYISAYTTLNELLAVFFLYIMLLEVIMSRTNQKRIILQFLRPNKFNCASLRRVTFDGGQAGRYAFTYKKIVMIEK